MSRHAIVRSIWSLVTVGMLASLTAAQTSQPAPSQTQTDTQSIPFYPNTPKGLETLMKEMMKLSKSKGHDEMARYAKSLELPHPEDWFKSVFGEKSGIQMAAASERSRIEISMSAPDLIARMRTEKLSEILAVRFDEECSPLATDSEFPFLQRRARAEPLYDVRFHNSSKALIWSYFAYVDGGFRYIGTLELNGSGSGYVPHKESAAASSPTQQNSPQRIKVDAHFQQAMLLASCRTVPVYPQEAKDAHISGTVVLHAIIGADGEVHELNFVSGPPELVKSAHDAVARWRYRPTLFNGEPVEVDTMITVVYTLDRT